jgi:hypothetical protein
VKKFYLFLSSTKTGFFLIAHKSFVCNQSIIQTHNLPNHGIQTVHQEDPCIRGKRIILKDKKKNQKKKFISTIRALYIVSRSKDVFVLSKSRQCMDKYFV